MQSLTQKKRKKCSTIRARHQRSHLKCFNNSICPLLPVSYYAKLLVQVATQLSIFIMIANGKKWISKILIFHLLAKEIQLASQLPSLLATRAMLLLRFLSRNELIDQSSTETGWRLASQLVICWFSSLLNEVAIASQLYVYRLSQLPVKSDPKNKYN